MRLILLLCSWLLMAPVFAGSFEKGLLSYEARFYGEAYRVWLPLAEQGDPDAQVYLGLMFLNGEGVERDSQESVKWFQKAAVQGLARAQRNLGFAYFKGFGVQKDLTKSVYWYSKAADQGDAEAQGNLGNRYRNGEGVTRDLSKAIALYRQSAEQGWASAQHNLGYEYFLGEAVEKNYATAMAWFRKAAAQGRADSMNNLGWMFANGLGVDRDATQAEFWYREAIKHGGINAPLNLAELLKTDCSKASTRLFDTLIRCSSRDALMEAVKGAGASVKREDKERWSDVYYSSNLLKDSSELRIAYTADDYFALAEYTFPGSMDLKQVDRIREMVAGKYGLPDHSSGSYHLGEVSFIWYLEDGIEMKVHRGWPDTTAYLTYIYPENYQAMKVEYERQLKARKAREAQAQSGVF